MAEEKNDLPTIKAPLGNMAYVSGNINIFLALVARVHARCMLSGQHRTKYIFRLSHTRLQWTTLKITLLSDFLINEIFVTFIHHHGM